MKVIIEAVKFTLKLEKKVPVYGALLALINSVIPYIPVFLSANIIDSLSSGGKFSDIIIMTAIGLAVIFTAQVIQKQIDKIFQYYGDIAVHNFNMENANKMFDFDFEQADSPATNKIRERINQDRSWGNYIYGVIWGYPWFLENIFRFIVAAAVLIPLFAHKSFWNGMTAIHFIILIIIVLIGILIRIKYVTPAMLKLFSQSDIGRNYFYHFLWFRENGYKEGKDIRIYDAEKVFVKYTDSKKDKDIVKEWSSRYARTSSVEGLLGGLSSGIITGGAYIIVVIRAAAGILSIGEVVKYCAAAANFIAGISGILEQFNEFAVASKRIQSTLEYLNIPSKMHKGTLPVEKRDDNEYEIEFKNVGFKYPGSDNYALKNLSMKFKIGQRLAVVGMNGSGKTTMIKLLCRLYDPTEGEITLNGFNIKKYDYNEYMSIFSVVFQDFKLFSFPLGQNIAASIGYDKEKAVEYLNEAGFSERFGKLEKGLETALYKDFEEDGVELSGGEAQKIALARALDKDAQFIILDEPTAALDPVAEFEVYSKFNEIVGGKTAVYISHRLSSCRFCDDIAVFHEGELIQRGSHDTLIADESGKYYELWNAQAQYYTENNEMNSAIT
jgi:ATP-binding cassette subfamily B protein